MFTLLFLDGSQFPLTTADAARLLNTMEDVEWKPVYNRGFLQDSTGEWSIMIPPTHAWRQMLADAGYDAP